jgi:hypothetical protein
MEFSWLGLSPLFGCNITLTLKIIHVNEIIFWIWFEIWNVKLYYKYLYYYIICKIAWSFVLLLDNVQSFEKTNSFEKCKWNQICWDSQIFFFFLVTKTPTLH